jgi:predicted  nucleic acid-binding Zn-ribbon protein
LLQNMRQLIVLRDIDEEIATVGSDLARIPEEREAIERGLLEARETLAQTRESLESDEVEERRLEGEMREQEALLQRLNAQSAQVTSPQAYEALQHELEHASTASSEFETRALELMESIDQLRGEVAAAEDRLQRVEEQAPVQLDELAARETRLTAEREALLERREKAGQRLDASLLAHYERVAQQRRPAVGIVEGEICSECRIAVPTMRASEIQRAEKVHACSGCRRLLVPVQALHE